ncbi:MFS transporter [Clostridium sp. ATCC 25772]|uniref:MFS transporter n=1 Tax=Clostridium sp. ATCC 25772 TaxID=1676991 RepID=UPI000783F1DF|nr:MFS transporter [Clostridium sp. ATCC 25772]
MGNTYLEVKKEKLWNKNFLLLWQGQLVSALGDMLYIFALEFWILDVTGSTTIMGLLTTLTMLPRIVLGPFIGVLVDRYNKKKVIVITDFIRGILITVVGISAIIGVIEVWMAFVVAVISGICAAFFNPAVMAIKPDIVPKSRLVQANSATSLAQSGMNMIGNGIGGVLYITLGASYLFLFNGLSYLFSAFTEIFISVESTVNKNFKVDFKEEFKEGFRFVWKFKTLRNIFLCNSILNFCFSGGMMLLKVYCTEISFLGVKGYGYLMTVFSIGAIISSTLLTMIKLERKLKFKAYVCSLIIFSITIFFLPLMKNYVLMMIIMFTMAFFNRIFNVILDSTKMLAIPANKRGQVLSILRTFSMGLAPLGTLVAGILSEFISVKYVMMLLFTVGILSIITCILVKGSKTLVEYEGQDFSLDDLINNTNKLYDM